MPIDARSALRLLGERLPITQGTVRAPGLRGPLKIGRDRWGIPHIDAGGAQDAWYGVGFCHAQDRGFQLEIMLRVGRGTLSALVGKEGLAIDRLSRRLGMHRVASKQLEIQDDDVRDLLEAYALGVNAGLEVGVRRRPHELALLASRPTPWTAADALTAPKVLGIGGLAENWAQEHARLAVATLDGAEALDAVDPRYPDRLATIADPDELRRGVDALDGDLDRLRRATGAGGGSNNWAIAGSRTESGLPLLANDPHLPPTVPGLFYLAHLHTPDWDLVGATTPGCPGMTIGHNGRVAWGVTAGMADVADLCVERLGPGGAGVLEGGRLTPCEAREELIDVRGRRRPIVERVTITPRGPIVSPAGEHGTPALSMRCALLDPAAKLTGPLRMQDVGSFEDLQREADGWPFPLNVVYADADGHVGWQLTGRIPRRRRGSGRAPGDAGWDGWLSSQQLPSASDPERGFLATANNRPLPQGAEPYLGEDWMDGYRAQAICEALGGREDWRPEDCRRLQLDARSLPWREMRGVVLGLDERGGDGTSGDRPGGREETGARPSGAHAADLRRGLDLLADWDGVVSVDSPAASVFELMLVEMARRVISARAPRSLPWSLGRSINPIDEHTTLGLRRVSQLVSLLAEQPAGWFPRGWQTELADALVAAVAQLRRERGEDPEGWAWGRIRTVTFEHPLGAQRPLGRVFNLPPIPCGGDTNTIPQASVDSLNPLGNPVFVAGLRAVFDASDWGSSGLVLATGQSGNPLSPHYEDQHELWRRGETIEVPFEQEAVEAAIVTTLDLRPAR